MKNLTFVIVVIALLFSGCGKTGGDPDTAAILISPAGVDAAEPAIAANANGDIFVAYVVHTSKDAADVFVRKFTADGKPAGDAVQVNSTGGSAKSWYGDPPTITVGADGTVYAGWTASVSGGSDLYLSVSHDNGKTFDASVKVNDDALPAEHGMHSLATDANGRVFMAWLDERNIKHEEKPVLASNADGYHYEMALHTESAGHPEQPREQHQMDAEPNSEVFFAVSTDGGKTFSANKKLATEVCPCCKTSLSVAPDGRVYVSWRQVLANGCRHIGVTSTNDGGATFADPVIVSDDKWQINACPVSGAAISAGENNTLDVAWYTAGDAGQPGLYTARSSDGGQTFGPRNLLSNEAVSGMPALLDDQRQQYFIFAANKTVEIKDANSASVDKIENAELPAAAVSGGKLYVAFVRKKGDARGVCLQGSRVD
jgi:hypothetical protein